MKATAKMITSAAFLALFAAASSAQVWNIAVVETEVDPASGASAGITSAEVRQVTSELRRAAVKSLPPAKYNIMTTETVYAQGGAVLEKCSEENCVVTLGGIIGADYIVRGIISKLRDRFTLSVEVYETDNGTLVALSPAVRAKSVEALVENAAPACKEMYEKFELTYGSKRRYLEKYVIVTRANPSKGGAVMRNPAQDEYAQGEGVEVAAVPAKGYAFTGWSGAASGMSNPISVTVNDNMMLMANFKYTDPNAVAKVYKLVTNVSPEDGGRVYRYPDAKEYTEKEEVGLSASPERGYKFLYWADDDEHGAPVAAKRDFTAAMDGDRAFTAKFKRIRFDFYFAPKYMLLAGIPSSWGGVDAELGLTWGNGSFLGFDFGGGGGDFDNSNGLQDGLQGGVGISLGFVYDVWNRLQIVYGAGAVSWSPENGEKIIIDSDAYFERKYLNFIAPRVGLRWTFVVSGIETAVELTYRGLLGYRYDDYYDGGTYTRSESSFGWNHHQLMLGLHVAGSKRWRKKK